MIQIIYDTCYILERIGYSSSNIETIRKSERGGSKKTKWFKSTGKFISCGMYELSNASFNCSHAKFNACNI